MARKRFKDDEDDVRAKRDDGLDGDFIEEEWQFVHSDDENDELSDFGVVKPSFYIDEDDEDDVEYVDEDEEDDDDGSWEDDEDDDDEDYEDEEDDLEEWAEEDDDEYDDEE